MASGVHIPAGGGGITVSAKARFEASSGNATSASYTVATDDVIVFTICTNTNFGDNNHIITKSAGTATVGTITQEALQQTGGQASLHWCRVTAGGTATFTVSTASTRTIVRPFVLTGCNTSDCIGAKTQGGSTTNNLTTTAVVTQAANSVIIIVDNEWNDLGNLTSTDLLDFDTFNGAGGSTSGCSGYKVSTSASQSITANCNAGGSGAADHDYCQVEFLAA